MGLAGQVSEAPAMQYQSAMSIVRKGLLPPPISIEIPHSSSDSNGSSGFAAQLPQCNDADLT